MKINICNQVYARIHEVPENKLVQLYRKKGNLIKDSIYLTIEQGKALMVKGPELTRVLVKKEDKSEEEETDTSYVADFFGLSNMQQDQLLLSTVKSENKILNPDRKGDQTLLDVNFDEEIKQEEPWRLRRSRYTRK